MSSIDERHKGRKKPVVRVEVPTIVVRISTATDGSVSFTLQLRDDNAAIHVSVASLADAAKTVLNSQKAAPDFDEVSVNGLITIGIDPDKDVGTNDVTVNIDLYGV